jgi:hypothetical protein
MGSSFYYHIITTLGLFLIVLIEVCNYKKIERFNWNLEAISKKNRILDERVKRAVDADGKTEVAFLRR